MRRLLLAGAAASALMVGPATAAVLFNEGFEAGTAVPSSYVFVPTPTGCCDGLWGEGTYALPTNTGSTSLVNYHSLLGPATAYSGNRFMAVNGASAPVTVWASAAPVTVTPGTTYYFSVWITSIYPVSPAQLAFKINDDLLVGIVAPPSTVGLWTQFFSPWTPGAGVTTASLSLVNQNLEPNGNDFGLDQVELATRPEDVRVSEPMSLAALGIGLLGLAIARRRRRVA